MQTLLLQTTIGPGRDKQVELLFEGPRRKIMQITLRNRAVLNAHKSAVPITIQCIAGSGTLAAAEEVQLTPGVLLTLEPNEIHEVRAQPEVSILLSQFTGAA
jgi:quercetin dioxygenase-like cupin family protein